MSDDYRLENEEKGGEEEEIKEGEEEAEEGAEEEEEELPSLSLQDIELLMKNTKVWDDLIAGKITIDQAKKMFEENLSKLYPTQKKKTSVTTKKKSIKAKKTKKKKEESEIEEGEEE